MARFEDLVAITSRLADREFVGASIRGKLLIDSEHTLAALLACREAVDSTALSLDGEHWVAPRIGDNVPVEIGTPRPGFGLIPRSIDDLLAYPGAHIREPHRYYLVELGYLSGADNPPPEILRYRAALKLVEMLRASAAFLDEQEELLVFLRSGKFDVPVAYGWADLDACDAAAVTELAGAVSRGFHEKQCYSIMAEAVYETCARLPADQRFGALLRNAKDVFQRFEDGYRLFAAGFSYEKVRDDIEAARVEYSGKIHNILSEIQGQLLGIPISSVIVATQMKESAAIDGAFWTNTAVLLGSFIYAVLMLFLLRNQQLTLEVVGIEIERQKRKLEKEHAAIADNFVETFRVLLDRFKSQRRILHVIDAVVVMGFLLSFFFYAKLNAPVSDWLLELCRQISSAYAG
jgi:hypothetical protein